MPANLKDYYPQPHHYSLLEQYEEGQKEWNERHKPNPFLAPPNNLSPGDSTDNLMKKFFMNRMSIFQDEARKSSPVVNNAVTAIEKTTSRDVAWTPPVRGMCEIKAQFNYDINQNTVAMKSVCESYNFRSVYSVFTNTYDVSLFKQTDNETKVGLRSTKPSENLLVFIEGSW